MQHTYAENDLVGLKLRDARKRRGLTMKETAAAIGISESLLCRIERGNRRATPALERRACAYLGLPFRPTSTSDTTTASTYAATATSSGFAVLPEDADERWSHSALKALGGVESSRAKMTEADLLADVSMKAAMNGMQQSFASGDVGERYRACRRLAEFASRPLELLQEVATQDSDPAVRAAARQLLGLLAEAYDAKP